jgi:phenylpropionate dioxygenase-like ring-hydroxylating dioxygenase large terminal subunit
MRTLSHSELSGLVQSDRVNRRIYLDPDLFELELRRIFYSAWIFVAHESQMPNVGDFICAQVGRQPLLLSRHSDGTIHAHYNRCVHRGALVVNAENGCAERYKCMYHGWTYGTDGRLLSSPRQSVEEAAGVDFSQTRLKAVANCDSYRGFIFVRLRQGGMSLEDFLGPTCPLIDNFVDASPEGAIEVSKTCHRFAFDGNWKHFLDQGGDTYHTLATHSSTLREDGSQFKRRSGSEGGGAAFKDKDGDAKILDLPIYTFPNGHVASGSLFDKEQRGGDWDIYRGQLTERYGRERAREILNPKFHDIAIFPSLGLNFVHGTIDLTLPLAVDKTELRVIPARRKGAPDSLYRDQIRYVNQSHGAAGHVRSDDAEAFRRVQRGLQAESLDWIVEARGLGRDRSYDQQTGYGDGTSEIGQRHVHRAWLEMLLADHSESGAQ